MTIAMSEAAAPALPEPVRPSFLRQSIGTVLSQGAYLVLATISSVLAARFLGPEGRGALAAATLGPSLVVVFVGFGVGLGCAYYVGRRAVDAEVALGTGLVVAMAIAAPGVAIYLLAMVALRDSVLQGLPWPLILLGAGLIPLTLVTRFALGVAQGLRRVAVINLANLVTWGVTVLLYAILLGFLGGGAGAGLVSVVAGSALGAAIAVGGLLRGLSRLRWDRAFALKAGRFGVRGYVGNVITLLTYRLDVFIVTGFLGLAEAGRYAVAFTVAELLWQAPNALALILFPRVAGAEQDAATVTARLFRLSVTGTALLALGGALLAPFAFPILFSSAFDSAIPAFQLLLPGVVLFAGGKLLATYLTGRGRPALPSTAAAIALPVVVGLDLLLIPRYGIAGASVASSVGYSVDALILAAMFLRHSGLRWRALLLPTGEDLRVVRTAFLGLLPKPAPR